MTGVNVAQRSPQASLFEKSRLYENSAAQYLYKVMLGVLAPPTPAQQFFDFFPEIKTLSDFEACKTVLALPEATPQMLHRLGPKWIVVANNWDKLCKIAELEARDRKKQGSFEGSLVAMNIRERRKAGISTQALTQQIDAYYSALVPNYIEDGWTVSSHFSHGHVFKMDGQHVRVAPKQNAFTMAKIGEPLRVVIV